MVEANRSKKGSGSVYQRASDKRWCEALPLATYDGVRRRKVVTISPYDDNGKLLTEARAKKILNAKTLPMKRELMLHGDIPTAGTTLSTWIDKWFTEISVKKIRSKSAASYRGLIDLHIKPAIGNVQVANLTPAHVRRVTAAMEAKGLSSTSARQAYQVLSTALEYAHREGLVVKNVAKLVDPPRRAKTQLAILTAADGLKVLQSVTEDRLGPRWAAALLTGARQGELLGLELDRVGEDLDLSWQLQRLIWSHGCGDKCGNKRGIDCPDRRMVFPNGSEHRQVGTGLWLTRPKSSAGWRIIPLVDPLRSIIERRVEVAATEPNPHGLLWTSPKLDGSPIDPREDSREWHAVLDRAGVPQVPLHAARHTTASLLLKAGVPMEVIRKILGHSTAAMSASYMDVDREQLKLALTNMSALMAVEGRA